MLVFCSQILRFYLTPNFQLINMKFFMADAYAIPDENDRVHPSLKRQKREECPGKICGVGCGDDCVCGEMNVCEAIRRN